MKKVLPLILALTILLTACGSNATPTIDAASVQASAVAMAFTMAAQTQAALPSPTPIPPTATATVPPPATPTTFALPTFPVAVPTATNVSGDECNALMAPNPGGPKVNLLIDNRTKGSVTLSLWLSPTPFSCGFAPVPFIGPNAKEKMSLPEGCYWPSAYINDPKKPRAIEPSKYLCMHSTDKITLVIEYTGFRYIYP